MTEYTIHICILSIMHWGVAVNSFWVGRVQLQWQLWSLCPTLIHRTAEEFCLCWWQSTRKWGQPHKYSLPFCFHTSVDGILFNRRTCTVGNVMDAINTWSYYKATCRKNHWVRYPHMYWKHRKRRLLWVFREQHF